MQTRYLLFSAFSLTYKYRTKDWTDVSNDDYWGGVSGKKTIYDPCPVGYKVPTCDKDGNTP